MRIYVFCTCAERGRERERARYGVLVYGAIGSPIVGL